MPTSAPVLSEWNEARRLSGRNFQCDRCDQRWFEDELREQDGLFICAQNCYEENGGEIDRQLERAAGASLAADLSAKEARSPQQPGWFDDQSIRVVSDISVRPVQVTRGGASNTTVLTGVGFAAADTITTDANITISTSLDSSTQITLTISAGASATRGLHDITYSYTYGSQTLTDVYRKCIDVH